MGGRKAGSTGAHEERINASLDELNDAPGPTGNTGDNERDTDQARRARAGELTPKRNSSVNPWVPSKGRLLTRRPVSINGQQAYHHQAA